VDPFQHRVDRFNDVDGSEAKRLNASLHKECIALSIG